MASVTGFVEKVKFRNEDNGYSVLSVVSNGEEYILVGIFHYIEEGELIEANGSMTEHPIYGEQLQVESYELKIPESTVAIERYLGSGAIKGVKAALAARIVRKFKADTFRIIEEEPERLSEVKGVSEKLAMSISSQMEEKKDMRQAMMFLQEYGISMNLAVKIYQEYASRLYGIIKENPYRLADDISGVGFKMADEIARKVGIFTDSDYRIKAGMVYTLFQAAAQGHTYLPKQELFDQAFELLNVETEQMEKQLMDLQMERRIVVKTVKTTFSDTSQPTGDLESTPEFVLPFFETVEDSKPWVEEDNSFIVYASAYYYMELNTAKMLHDLNIRGDVPIEKIQKKILRIQKEENKELDALQA